MTRDTTDWTLIALLYAAGLLAAGQFAKIALLLGDLSLIYPGRAVAFLVSGVSIAGIVFGVTAGVVIARIGAGRALVLGLGAAAVLTGLQALTPSYPLMMTLRVVEGAAHLAIVVAAPTLMARAAVGRDVPVAMGVWGTFFGVGFAVAAAIYPLAGGLSSVLLLNAGAMLLVLFLLVPRLPPAAPNISVGPGFFGRHVAVYGDPRLVAPAFGFFAHTVVFLGLLTFLPSLLGRWTAPVLPMVALAGTIGAGFVARHASPRAITLWAFAISVPGMLLATALPGAAQTALAMTVMIFIGAVPGAAFAMVPWLNETPSDQARANGAIAQLGNVGTALSAPVFAAALAFGFTGIAMTFALISAAGFAAVALIHRKIGQAT